MHKIPFYYETYPLGTYVGLYPLNFDILLSSSAVYSLSVLGNVVSSMENDLISTEKSNGFRISSED